MSKKAKYIIFGFLGMLSLLIFIYQLQYLGDTKVYHERQTIIMAELSDDLGKFQPLLAEFVDEDYNSVMVSDINSDGTTTFRRALGKNSTYIGEYHLTYDLINEKIIYENIEILNEKYLDDWNRFKQENQEA